MKMDNYKIGTRLTMGFVLLMLLMLAVGSLALQQMGILAGLVNKMYTHPLTVGYAMRDIRFEIDQMYNHFQRVMFLGDVDEMDDIRKHIDSGQMRVLGQFELVMDRFLGDRNDVTIARDAFIQWKKDLDKQLILARSGKISVSGRAFYLTELKRMEELQTKLQVMINFAIGKAQGFMDETSVQEGRARKTVALFLVAILLLTMTIAVLVTRSIAPPLNRIVWHMKKIVEGDLRHDVDIDQKDEIGALAESFREMQAGLRAKADVAIAIAAGDLDQKVEVSGRDDQLGNAINQMTVALKASKAQRDLQDWIKTGKNDLNRIIVGARDLKRLSVEMLGFFADYLKAQVGTLYVAGEGGDLILQGSYAAESTEALPETISPGEGIVGQVALEKKMISMRNVPPGYLRISSSIGDSLPHHIIAVPLLFENKIQGVIELGAIEEFPTAQIDFLQESSNAAAIAVHTVQNHAMLEKLLSQTQTQADRLQVQEEELRAANEELEEQTRTLQYSGEQLKDQQEKLESINAELEEKNQYLEEQKRQIDHKNQALEYAQGELELRARELEMTSRYKSEFLAGMSHELRTPLNSLLLLARDLELNEAGNLSPDQVESAGIIHRSGLELLQLINEVLDLSKIEAGRLSVRLDLVDLEELAESLTQSFKHVAVQKGLGFRIERMQDLPATIKTDGQRLMQILKNLVANALKFTEKGSVTVSFGRPSAGTDLTRSQLGADTSLAFSVRDTGIGIPENQQDRIFEAFRQVDGGISRKFGGTGLGLSIARELAKLLGGELQLASTPGKGSEFTLYLPLAIEEDIHVAQRDPNGAPAERQTVSAVSYTVPAPSEPMEDRMPSIPDDRCEAETDDRFILIVEDDPEFARILRNQCHQKGFKALVSHSGEEGLHLAEKFLPEAVLLDVRLPGISGCTVLNTLKKNTATRHIPVHIISVEESSMMCLQSGAVGFTTKPVSREQLERMFDTLEQTIDKKVKDLLLVEDNADQRLGIAKLLGGMDLNIVVAENGADALSAVKKNHYDCMILDLGLPDMSGFDLLNRLDAGSHGSMPPVIVYTGKDLTRQEEMELRKYAETIIIKGVKSEERLLDEVSLFLHKTLGSLPPAKQKLIASLHDRDAVLSGKTILLVDDDMRNLFALSKLLTEKGLDVVKAEDGQKALTLLGAHPDIALVLLDIMMPGMDGYQTAREIRKQACFNDLPVIALTAKALKEDRIKCIEAGANDYLTKPVEFDRLLSMLRVWLYRQKCVL